MAAEGEGRSLIDALKQRTPEQLARRTINQKWIELSHHYRAPTDLKPVSASSSLFGIDRYRTLDYDVRLRDLYLHGDPAEKPLTRMWNLPVNQWISYISENASVQNAKDLAHRAAVRYNRDFVQTGRGSPTFGRSAPFYHIFIGWVLAGSLVFAWPHGKAHRKYEYH